MNTPEIMHIYNEYERKGSNLDSYKKVVTPELVKFVSEQKYGSHIAYFELTNGNMDRVIQQEVNYFSELGLSFEWKIYDTDLPVSIGEKLQFYGFKKEEPESFMALGLDSLPEFDIENDLCFEVNDEKGIRDAISIQEQVWGGDYSGQLAQLVSAKKSSPDDLTIYVVYENSFPVASGWIAYTPDSPFSGIWGGSTLKESRGKGYYSNLLHKRISDAIKRGKKYLVIDASAMSRPIVEKYGFQFVATTIPYTMGGS